MLRVVFFFQAEDGIRDLVRSRGLGDVYKRQVQTGDHVEESGLASTVGTDQAIHLAPVDRDAHILSLIHI